jgi:hypothetical protein
LDERRLGDEGGGCSDVGDMMVGDNKLRIEFDEERREMYGRGGGFGLSLSAVGEVAVGILGDLSAGLGESILPTSSIPNSSVKGRGGGRSTMASRS